MCAACPAWPSRPTLSSSRRLKRCPDDESARRFKICHAETFGRRRRPARRPWLALVAAVGIVLVWMALVLATYNAVADSDLDQLRRTSRQRLDFLTAVTRQTLQKYESMPYVLSQQGELVDLLEHPDDARRVRSVNDYLKRVKRKDRAAHGLPAEQQRQGDRVEQLERPRHFRRPGLLVSALLSRGGATPGRKVLRRGHDHCGAGLLPVVPAFPAGNRPLGQQGCADTDRRCRRQDQPRRPGTGVERRCGRGRARGCRRHCLSEQRTATGAIGRSRRSLLTPRTDCFRRVSTATLSCRRFPFVRRGPRGAARCWRPRSDLVHFAGSGPAPALLMQTAAGRTTGLEADLVQQHRSGIHGRTRCRHCDGPCLRTRRTVDHHALAAAQPTAGAAGREDRAAARQR